MTKRFVIATDPLTPAEEKKLQTYLRGHGWWKWLPNFWLCADTKEELTTTSIRDKIREINNTARAWVLEVEPVNWSALTLKDSSGRDGSEWVEKNWDAD